MSRSNPILQIYLPTFSAYQSNLILYSNKWTYYNVYFFILLFSHSVMSNSVTPYVSAHQAAQSLSCIPEPSQFHVHWVVMPSNHLIICCPLLLLPFPASGSFLMSWSLIRIRGPKYWSFGISPSHEYLALISFKIDWFDLLAAQGILKSLLQHHSAKASILWHSALFTVQLSHPYVTTGKNIALTKWTFVGKVMSLLFNMLSRFVIAFPVRSKCLLISWLQSPSAVIWEPKKINPLTVSIVYPSIWMKWWDCMRWSSVFEHWIFSQLFHSALSPSSRGSLISHILFEKQP